MIALSTITYQTPLVCDHWSLIHDVVQQKTPSGLDELAQGSNGNDQKFITICQVFIMAGRALDYIHKTRTNSLPREDCTVIDDEMRALVQNLIKREGSHGWTFCDSIAMALR